MTTTPHIQRPEQRRERTLPKLPQPLLFVRRQVEQCRALMPADDACTPDEVPELFRIGIDNWITQTYLWLKQRGHDVHLVDDFVRDAVCVAHYDNLSVREFPARSYVVAVNADRPRAHLCSKRVVQCHLQVKDANDHEITHWPQPGLVRRDPARGSRLERLAYVGMFFLDDYSSTRFQQRLAELGVTMVVKTYPKWTDFSDVDAVLAIRKQPDEVAATKPPTKLINAWWSECPALLGHEPAFAHLKQSELDYIEVGNEDDVLDAVERLQRDPALYARMVDNGIKRREAYSVEAICRQWENLLAGPVAADYASWRRGREPMRSLRLIGRGIFNAALHWRERKRWDRLFRDEQ